jgi:hypothetical protein
MAHHGHDWWPPNEISSVIDKFRDVLSVISSPDDLDTAVKFSCDNFDHIVGKGLSKRGHFTKCHKLLDDLWHWHVEIFGYVLDCRTRVDLDLGRTLCWTIRCLSENLVVRTSASTLSALATAAGPLCRRTASARLTSRCLRVDNNPTPTGS